MDYLIPDRVVSIMYSNPAYQKQFINVKLWLSEEKIIKEYFKPRSSVLDVACGAGRVSIALSLRGYIVTGIDKLPQMIKAFKQQKKKYHTQTQIVQGDAGDMHHFAGDLFDNVVMAYNAYELVHGKEKRCKVLMEIARVLKPHGYFILTIRSGFAFGKRMVWWLLFPFHYPYYKIRFQGKCEWTVGDAMRGKSYHHYYNPFSIKKFVENFGFQLVEFNSASNFEKNKKPSLFTYFSPDIALFYVFQKISTE